ncbi:hypothetical protein ACWGB8_19565 [Kitasatospora sp. NPDC054939]
MITDIDPRALADRYAALWNEPDAGVRRKAIEALWAEDGVHLLQPPEDIRERAAGLGFDRSVLEARGYAALEVRVARAYEEFVAPGEYVFRAVGEAVLLRDVLAFGWEMARTADGEVVGGGREFVVLDGDGRIRADYQFPA